MQKQDGLLDCQHLSHSTEQGKARHFNSTVKQEGICSEEDGKDWITQIWQSTIKNDGLTFFF